MGYTTEFKGVLEFTKELSSSDLNYINQFLNEDIRDHKQEPEWNYKFEDCLYSIDLELTKDFSGIQWTGVEKTYGMVEAVNFIITKLKERNLKFGLKGKFTAQGESIDDRWELIINKNGFAEKRELKPIGTKIKCPHCDEYFYIEEEE